jgi:hypothetical protein
MRSEGPQRAVRLERLGSAKQLGALTTRGADWLQHPQSAATGGTKVWGRMASSSDQRSPRRGLTSREKGQERRATGTGGGIRRTQAARAVTIEEEQRIGLEQQEAFVHSFGLHTPVEQIPNRPGTSSQVAVA